MFMFNRSPWHRRLIALLLAMAILLLGSTTPKTSLADAGAVATFSQTSIAFGNQTVNTTSSTQQVTLQNTGTGALNVSSIVVSGPNASYFNMASGCGSLQPGDTCTLDINFSPAATGAASAQIVVTDDATPDGSQTTQTIALSGNGTQGDAQVQPALTFADQIVYSTSAAQTVVLTNTGTSDLHIGSISITGAQAANFAQSNACGTIAAGATCSIYVSFSPVTTGTLTATLQIQDDAASGSVQNVALSGNGLAPSVLITPSTTLPSFGSAPIGTIGTSQVVTVTNVGTSPLNPNASLANGTNFYLQGDTCSGTAVAVGATCNITVTFAPSITGTVSDQLQIFDDAFNASSPQTIGLTGIGAYAAVALVPNPLNFATQIVNTTAAKVVTVTNTTPITGSGVPLHIYSMSVTGAYTIPALSYPITVAVGASIPVTVSFAPTTTGTLTGSLTLTDDAGGVITPTTATQVESLNGTAQSAANATSTAAAATSSANSTATAIANTTATAVAKVTQTAAAGQTATAAANATSTAKAGQTATSIAATSTAAALQTAVAAGKATGTAVAAAHASATAAVATGTAAAKATSTAAAAATGTAAAQATSTAAAQATSTAAAKATSTAAAAKTATAQPTATATHIPATSTAVVSTATSTPVTENATATPTEQTKHQSITPRITLTLQNGAILHRGDAVTVRVHVAPDRQVTVIVRILLPVDHVRGTGKKRHHVHSTTLLYEMSLTERADHHGNVALLLHPRIAMRNTVHGQVIITVKSARTSTAVSLPIQLVPNTRHNRHKH